MESEEEPNVEMLMVDYDEVQESSDEDDADEGGEEDDDDREEDDNEDEGGEGLVDPKRKSKDPSPVWAFGGIMVKGGAKCRVCGKVYRTTTRNTSNLVKHIISKHKNKPEGKMLKIEMDKKRKRKDEAMKLKDAKKADQKKFSQSSMINFTRKAFQIDPLKKKRIEQAIMRHIVVENEPFSLVEKHSFRELMFAAEPAYICSSHTSVRTKFDAFAQDLKKDLKKELEKDLSEVDDKSVHITSDHGTSHDRFRSHKNVLTLARCTTDFEIKTDTIAVMKCDGSQTGDVIRQDVKNELDKVGRDDSWIVNWVTDGEAKQISARTPGKHPRVGLRTHHTGNSKVILI
jgi:hypothetical protein